MNKPQNGPFAAPHARPGSSPPTSGLPERKSPPPQNDPVQAQAEDGDPVVASPEQEMTRFWQGVADAATKNAVEAQHEADRLRRRIAALEAYRPGVRGFRPGPLLDNHVDPGDNSAFARLRRLVIADSVELGWRISRLEERLQEYQQADEAQTARIQAMEQALQEIQTCAGVEAAYYDEEAQTPLRYLASVAAAGLAGSYPDAPQLTCPQLLYQSQC